MTAERFRELLEQGSDAERAAMLSTLEEIAIWLVESGAFDDRGGP